MSLMDIPDNDGAAVEQPQGGAEQQNPPAEQSQQQVQQVQQQPKDWRSELPEELRSDPAFESLKTLPDLAKSYLNTKKLVGKKTVGLPDQNSSAEEWGKFWDSLGRPSAPERYELQRNGEIPKEMIDEAGAKRLMAKAHELGITKSQLQGLTEEFDSQLLEGFKSGQTAEAERQAAGVARLRKAWGNEVQSRAYRAEQTLNTIDPEGKIDREALKGNPEVLMLLDSFASRVLGDKLPEVNGEQTNLAERASQLRAHPAFSNENHQDHARIMADLKIVMQQISAQKQRRR